MLNTLKRPRVGYGANNEHSQAALIFALQHESHAWLATAAQGGGYTAPELRIVMCDEKVGNSDAVQVV